MNKKLQDILNLIEQNKNLTAEEKESVFKALKDVNKELEITAFKLERTEKIKKTTAILLEETIEELEQKQKAVEAQNRELEIETALEKVRSSALAMKEPAEMVGVCRIISDQLQLLGVKDIRNVQTAIINEQKSTYLNYQYFTAYNKSTIELAEYNKHPKAREFAETMKKSANAFYSQSFDDEELGVFREYRKQDDQFPDPILDEAASLHFYFYSIGPGALGISTYNTPLSESGMNILKRFRNVFELAYRRFTDIELAIAQARESKIEAALEKVRAVAMSMNKPDDLLNVCEVLFKEFYKLGFDEMRNAMINIHNDEKKTFLNYDYSDEIGKSVTLLNFNSHPVMEKQINQSRMANDAFSEAVYKGKDLEAWKEFRRKYGEKDDPRIKNIAALYYYFYSIGNGTIGISTFSPVNEEKLSLLKRFRNVFSLSYQRYSDIALAEAQAKESQIQLALERVRARTMAMHHSDELAETAYVLFQQFKEIDKEPKMITIGIMNEKENVIEFWVTDWSGGGSKINQKFHGSTDEPTILNKIYKAWENGSRSIVVELAGKNLQKWVDYRVKISGIPDDKDYSNEKGFVVAAFFSNGILSFSIYEPVSPETIQLLERFAGVFDITYTRFLDLQKAEAQAREAQIELGLERVRARAMAMQKSEELSELVDTVFKELTKLDFALTWCIINIIDESSLSNTVWAANPDIDKAPESYHMKFEDYPFHHAMMKGYQERRTKLVYVLEGQEKKIYDEYLFNETAFRKVPAAAQAASRAMEKYVVTFTFSNFGGLQTVGETPLSDANLDILSRFGKVFDLTYTRFNDLKLAEAQAREAQIEAALERVRSRSMGMQKSEELKEVIKIVYQQLTHLKIKLDHSGFVVDYTPRGDWHFWIADERDIPSKITHPYFESVWANQFDEAKEKGVDFFTTNLNFEEKNKFYNELLSYVPRLPEASKEFYLSCPGLAATTVLMDNVGLYIENFSGISYSDEENATLMRFGKVFQQTYTRFLDLQKAEAQTREAQIELALERVRARTMAMHKSDELSEAAYLLFQQFRELGQEPEQFTIGIMNEAEHEIEFWHTWLGSPLDNRVIMSIDEPHVASKIFKAWKEQNKSAMIDLSGKELREYNSYRKMALKKANVNLVTVLDEEERRIIYLACFSKGTISISTHEPRPAETIQLLERFAGVFDLTYTRFLDLQKAEAQAREAQIETALERVRSRTMAMHESNELAETAAVLFKQLIDLGIAPNRSYIAIMKDESGDAEFWITDEDGSKVSSGFSANLNDNRTFQNMFTGWTEKKKSITIDMQGKELEDYLKHLSKLNVPFKGGLTQKRRVQNIAYFSQGFIGIASPDLEPEESVNLLERFAAVFNLTYRRFLDLQKAEAQTREAQIELALERVRARTMAMQSSNELVDTSTVLFHQLKILGVDSIRTGVATMDEVNETVEVWSTSGMSDNFEKKILGVVPTKVHPMFTGIFNSWKNKEPYFAYELKGDELKKYYKTLSSYLSYPEQEKFNEREIIYTFFFPEGSLNVVSQNTLTEDECNLTIRFAKVFGLVYRRFLDLQKAEAQAREAQIEAALERVRGKAMAMHTSNDLSETMGVLFTELPKLGISSLRCGVVLLSKNSRKGVFYAAATTSESDSFTMIGAGDMAEHPVFLKQYENWLNNENYFTTLSDDELRSYYEAIFARLSIPYIPREHKIQTEHGYYFPFSEGMFYAWAEEPYSKNEINILNRFKVIFDLTFRRYFDLQKAEAQAREAKIEAALERIRSRTMAMQHSEELQEAALLLFQQVKDLGVETGSCGFNIWEENTKNTKSWMSSPQGGFQPSFKLSHSESPIYKDIYSAMKNGEEFFVRESSGEELKNHFKYLTTVPVIGDVIKKYFETGYQFPEKIFYHIAFFKQGYLTFHLYESSSEAGDIFKRFANVFEQTYTRFLDLQKAEAQAREANIEVSLERVRSKAMAMHSPNDLSETVNVFFKELKTLGIIPIRCGVGQIDEVNRTTSLTTTTSSQQGDSFQVIGKIKQTGHPVLDGIFDHWKLQIEYHPVLEGEDIKTYYNVMNAQIGYPEYPEGITQYGNCFFFKEGFVFAWTESKLSEEQLQIFRRFTSVLSLTYRRYIDLKEAEVRAFEAVRQASLDRVRAEIASMRSTEDLNHITPIIWRELKTLEVPFFRCGVFIVDEANSKVQVYLTTPDGKSLGVLNFPIDSNELTSNTVEYWKKKKVYKEHWNKEQFIKWTMSMIEQGQVQNAETYQGSANPPDSLDLHFVPFTQGMLYVGDTLPLSDEKLQLVKTLAEAFSIAYARYEDFKLLEEAKNRIEVTLSELKSAQAQLIHSEKMASLGELTAGIAHEIKNPLNFVNNFSEISRELLDEMKIEIQNNNLEEVIEIVRDLKQNLEKINQHGKRADSIVKGMLLHSRGSSGEKVLTNINELLDQYVALAYHGLRAQDKEFNISIEKNYDETLEKINVVPQDISRVFLNIINNACYAAFDKKKSGGNDFSPMLKVSTKNLKDKVEIRIGDNGDGIPADHLDKIFQPFFTTKPTGEGTGLGLSLSYDIVTKVHGGDLKVETKANEGSEFIIQIPLY